MPVGLHRRDGLAAGLALLRVEHRARVVQGRLDDREHVQRVGRATPGPAARSTASANGDSGWLSAKSSCRSPTSRTRRPSASGSGSCSTTPAAQQRPVDGDGPQDVPALPRARLVVVLQQVPHRGERVAGAGDDVQQHRVRDREVAGQRLGLGVLQLLEAGLPTSRRSPPAAACARSACASSRRRRPGRAAGRSPPRGRAPRRRRCRRCRSRPGPARPAIWWNSRALSGRVRCPSYLVSAVNSTVRIGTLMPTPRVSVPQMTRSSPAWARVSTSRR